MRWLCFCLIADEHKSSDRRGRSRSNLACHGSGMSPQSGRQQTGSKHRAMSADRFMMPDRLRLDGVGGLAFDLMQARSRPLTGLGNDASACTRATRSSTYWGMIRTLTFVVPTPRSPNSLPVNSKLVCSALATRVTMMLSPHSSAMSRLANNRWRRPPSWPIAIGFRSL